MSSWYEILVLRQRNVYRRMMGLRPFTEAEWAAIDAAEQAAKEQAQGREDWQENTTAGWAKWFGVTPKSITNWASEGNGWIEQVKHGRYRVNVNSPEAMTRRNEVTGK